MLAHGNPNKLFNNTMSLYLYHMQTDTDCLEGNLISLYGYIHPYKYQSSLAPSTLNCQYRIASIFL